jgi:hypothetical protein
MESNSQECRFKIGDFVVFCPDERTVGWSYPTFDRVKLKPGDSGTVTRIERGMYLYLDGDRGGFHWQCFRAQSESTDFRKTVG